MYFFSFITLAQNSLIFVTTSINCENFQSHSGQTSFNKSRPSESRGVEKVVLASNLGSSLGKFWFKINTNTKTFGIFCLSLASILNTLLSMNILIYIASSNSVTLI